MSDTVSDILGLLKRRGHEASGVEPVRSTGMPYRALCSPEPLARARRLLPPRCRTMSVTWSAPRTSVPPSAASTGYTNVSDRGLFALSSALT